MDRLPRMVGVTMRSLRSRPLLLALLLVLFGGVAVAGNPTLRAIAQRPFAAQGTVVVPDRFVRAWDPVTVFFDSARGTPGPEDHPERWVTMAPEHPGAWTWLDGRTLQFRPAVPWPALARYGWTVDGHTTELTTLMAPPAQTSPSDGEEGLSPVETITLGFSEKLDPEALRHMVGIELRPLPGIDASAARWLSPSDLSIKAMEEPPADGQTWTPPLTMTPPPEPDTGSAPEEGEGSGDTGGGGRSGDTGRRPEAPPVALHRYVLTLATPIPLGTRAILHFRLSRDDSARDSVHEVAFSTAEPFRVQALGCEIGRAHV